MAGDAARKVQSEPPESPVRAKPEDPKNKGPARALTEGPGGVEASEGDTTVEARSSGTTVDARSSDTTVEARSSDTTVDARSSDTTVDARSSDTTAAPARRSDATAGARGGSVRHQPKAAGHPSRIGPYPILEELGRGGMGIVYLAQDPRLKRHVAIKVLPPELVPKIGLGRFVQEAQLLAAMNHPNIATIHSLEQDGEIHFLTMEFVPGGTLAGFISEGPIPVERTLRYCRQVAQALEAAHKKGVIHRDLKPLNIKVTPEETVKVLDFGLAQTAAALERATDGFVGTPGYMSPEQLRCQRIDHRSDIWAFGCILYECLTGRVAFPGKGINERTRATLESEPDWSALPEDIPERVRVLLPRCLTKLVDDRLSGIAVARQELEEEIAQVSLPPVVAPSDVRLHNLPAQLASFVGRETQVAEVKRALAGNRLVTLTGAGGCGKTRLALKVAEEVLPERADGAWLVELAPLENAEAVPQAVVQALRVPELPGRSLFESLEQYLRSRHVLLILDNCEHLLGSCATLVNDLLRSCRDLRVLATSREGLGITGEAIYHVPSLTVPSETGRQHPEELLETESVRLFTDRAVGVKADFELTPDNAAAVVQLCRRLDGIPLALELAAARVNVLSVEEIAERLSDRFQLLASRSQTALKRHQTLRALIDWSYEHLERSEQALFRRLAIHAGGWTLDAAEAVGTGNGIEEWEVLDLLSRLVDKSLVEVDVEGRRETGKARYRMLETVRQYARDRLVEEGEHDDCRRRHREHFVKLAEEAEPRLRGAEQSTWLTRLQSDHENLRAALDACTGEDREVELGLRLAGALGRYWYVRGHWHEGRSLFSALANCPGASQPTDGRAKVLYWAGQMAFCQGDYDDATAAFEESASICNLLGDRWGVSAAMNGLASVATMLGDYTQARSFYEEALADMRKCGDPLGIASTLNNLGNVTYMMRDYAGAQACYEESLKIQRQAGDPLGVGWLLNNLAIVARGQQDYERAQKLYEESLSIFRELKSGAHVCKSLTGLGIVAQKQGDYEKARRCYRESLMIQSDLGDREDVAWSLEALGSLAVALQDPRRAARLFGAAEALRKEIGTPLPPDEKQELDIEVRRAREALGNDSFETAWTEGQALAVDTAVELALSEVDA